MFFLVLLFCFCVCESLTSVTYTECVLLLFIPHSVQPGCCVLEAQFYAQLRLKGSFMFHNQRFGSIPCNQVYFPLFPSVFTRNEKPGAASRAHSEAGGQRGSGVCLFSPPALEEDRRGSKSAALHMGRQ